MSIKELAIATDTELYELYEKSVSIQMQIESYMTRTYKPESYVEQIAKLRAQLVPINERTAELNEIYKAHKWNRAFLVQNTNGHIHSSMSCSTCFPSTYYAWITYLSASTEQEIVEAAGETACTVCYPSAPAEVLGKPSTIVTAEKIEKEKSKAEREAKKAEKASARPTPNGEPLIVPETWAIRQSKELKTERAASMFYVEVQYEIQKGGSWTVRKWEEIENGVEVMQAACVKVVNSVAAKRGVSAETIYAEWNPKVAKRIKRGY